MKGRAPEPDPKWSAWIDARFPGWRRLGPGKDRRSIIFDHEGRILRLVIYNMDWYRSLLESDAWKVGEESGLVPQTQILEVLPDAFLVEHERLALGHTTQRLRALQLGRLTANFPDCMIGDVTAGNFSRTGVFLDLPSIRQFEGDKAQKLLDLMHRFLGQRRRGSRWRTWIARPPFSWAWAIVRRLPGGKVVQQRGQRATGSSPLTKKEFDHQVQQVIEAVR